MAGSRMMGLRYPGRCARCGTAADKGVLACRDAVTKQIYCKACAPCDATDSDDSAAKSASGGGLSDRAGIDPGVAGSSAQRKYDHQVAKRERSVRSRHPIIGGVLLALFDEPQHTRAWAAGAKGERAVSRTLESLAEQGVVTLHDRRIPGTRANIDHIAIAPSGIYVIDAKFRETGRVTKRPEGPIWNPGPGCLYVGDRNCTSLVGKMAGQVSAVTTAVQDVPGARVVPIQPMLVFVNAEWGFLASPFTLAGVWVGSRKAMAKTVGGPGPMGTTGIEMLEQAIATRLMPA